MCNYIQLGGSVHQVPFIQYIVRDYRICTLDNNPLNPGHKISSNYLNYSILDKENLKRLYKDGKKFSSFGSDLAERIRLEVINQKHCVRYLLTSKKSARKIISEVSKSIGIPFIKVVKENSINDQSIIIKPNISSGSKGISVMTKFDKNIFQKKIDFAKNKSIDSQNIVELLFDGDKTKYYAEAYCLKGEEPVFVWGKSIQRNNTLINDGSLQLGDSFDETEVSSQLKKFIKQLVKIINIEFVPLNIDFFWDKNKITIIESTPRPGGNCLGLLLNLKTFDNYFTNLKNYYFQINNNYMETNFSSLKDFDNMYFITMTNFLNKNCINFPDDYFLINEYNRQIKDKSGYSGFRIYSMKK